MLSVQAAGVDTWSPAWYVDEDSPAARAMKALATQPSARGSMVPEKIGGHTLGWFPASRLIYMEGHPVAGGLAPSRALPEALAQLHEAAADYGVPLPLQDHRDDRPGFAGFRRIDATADLRFASSAEGLAVLAGVAALGLPRCKQAVWRGVPRTPSDKPGPVAQGFLDQLGLKRQPPDRSQRAPIETVAFYGVAGKKMLARWYDKGVESGAAPRGRLIRPEDQRRYVKDTRRGVEAIADGYVKDQFQRRFLPLWKASKGVTVGGSRVLAAKLADLVEAGDVSEAMAERMAGFAVLQDAGVWAGSRPTYYRRRAALRENGLVLSDLGLDEVEVDLHEVLEAALDSDAWDRRG